MKLSSIAVAPPKSKRELKVYLHWLQHNGFSGRVLHPGESISTPLLLCGGADIGVNQERDSQEIAWIQQALDAKQPIIGICRGMQLLNHFFGGRVESLDAMLTEEHQLDDFSKSKSHHEMGSHFHPVIDSRGSTMRVNSRHHQYCSQLADNFVVTHTTVGAGEIVEGIRDKHLKIWAVQWHPERFESDDNRYPLNML